MENTYLKNESLKTIKPDWRGNLMEEGRFVNPEKPYKPSFLKALKWKLSANPQKKEKKDDLWRPKVHKDGKFLEEKKNMIVWLGHASFLIKLDGITLITDPVFFNLPFMKRETSLPCEPNQFTGIDYVLLSHGHMDHADRKSFEILSKKNNFQVLTTLKLGTLLKGWNKNLNIHEAGWYQEYNLPNSSVKIFMLPAHHWYKRTAWDDNKYLWGSFIIQGAGKTIYFGADTGYDSHFSEIQKLFPEIDICILGVGAYSPAYMMKDSHMNPTEAVQAFHELKGKTFIPMHYGTFDLSDEPMGEPIRMLHQMQKENKISGELKVLDVGLPYLF